MEGAKAIVAYCASRRCDPDQKSARGIIKSDAKAGQKTCECGWPLFWGPKDLRFRMGRPKFGKNHGRRKEEREYKTKFR